MNVIDKCITMNFNLLHIFNIGTGKYYSVLDLISTFERVSKVRIPYTIGKRRPGDIDSVFMKINTSTFETLNWKPVYTLEQSCENAWNFIKKLYGY